MQGRRTVKHSEVLEAIKLIISDRLPLNFRITNPQKYCRFGFFEFRTYAFFAIYLNYSSIIHVLQYHHLLLFGQK